MCEEVEEVGRWLETDHGEPANHREDFGFYYKQLGSRWNVFYNFEKGKPSELGYVYIFKLSF